MSRDAGVLSAGLSLAEGAARTLGTLASAHLHYARREASTDLGRIALGAVLLGLGMALFAVAVLVGHGAIVLLLHDVFRLSWPRAFAVVAGVDTLLAILLIVVAKSRLNKPMLAETRNMLKRTATTLSEP